MMPEGIKRQLIEETKKNIEEHQKQLERFQEEIQHYKNRADTVMEAKKSLIDRLVVLEKIV